MTSEEESQGTEEYLYEFKIAKDRVAVLIGKKGEVKKQLEQATKTKIDVDSKQGDVRVSGKDPITLYNAREIIKAIGRGFNPEIAQLLLKTDYGFELINIADYAKTKKDLDRLKGRVIGQEGKARQTIEDLTESHICIYGKTISVIGRFECLPLVRHAIEALLTGAMHSSVYKKLEKKKRDTAWR